MATLIDLFQSAALLVCGGAAGYALRRTRRIEARIRSVHKHLDRIDETDCPPIVGGCWFSPRQELHLVENHAPKRWRLLGKIVDERPAATAVVAMVTAAGIAAALCTTTAFCGDDGTTSRPAPTPATAPVQTPAAAVLAASTTRPDPGETTDGVSAARSAPPVLAPSVKKSKNHHSAAPPSPADRHRPARTGPAGAHR